MRSRAFATPLGIACLIPLIVFALTRCAFLREAIGFELRRPQLALSDVSVEGASLSALDLALVIRVDNPNDFALEFAKLDYDVKVDGIELAKGRYDQKISLPAEGHILVKLPLRVQTNHAFAIVTKVVGSSQESFAEVQATADFVTPIGSLAVKFNDRKPLRKFTGL
jgi:LEA14-like dessication related protein